jgi:divalent metal cation (Fe/Co/Zn/Cd) transporter
VLAYVTVGYNILEGVVSIVFARRAGSPALLGFGIDSFVESLSGLVMIWRFARSDQIESAANERRERIAIRLVAMSLIVLSLYVAYESIRKLYYQESLDRHLAGQVIAAVSLITMPILFVAKRRTAAAIESHSLAADAKQTLGCVVLSVALLVGSGLNYWLGWWQADPIAGLLIAAFLAREGWKAWATRDLCCC